FGLKEVANRLYDIGLIETTWQKSSNSCANGNKSMIMAYQVHRESVEKNIPINKNPIMISIMEYNKIDCLIIHEIIDLLRKKIQQDNKKTNTYQTNLRRSRRLIEKKQKENKQKEDDIVIDVTDEEDIIIDVANNKKDMDANDSDSIFTDASENKFNGSDDSDD